VIRRVRVRNFTSHSDTEIEFPEGLTIFVGRNGAGKSSVIDAITYALYGKTTRGELRNIVRDGAGGGEVVLEFSHRGRGYRVMRRFDHNGRLLAAAMRDGEDRLLASGEREVSGHVEQLLGLGYERVRSAVIVQQGELDRILNERPADVKMLFDDLLGLSKMERAYENMRDVLAEFEKRVRSEVGRSIGEAEQVAEEQRRKEDELNSLQEEVGRIEREVEDLEKDLEELSYRKKALEEVASLYDEVRKNTIRLAEAVRRRIRDLEKAKPYICLLEEISKDEVERRIKQLEDLRNSWERISREISGLEGERNSKKKTLEEFDKDLEKLAVDGLAEEAAKVGTLEELSGEADQEARKLIRDSIEAGRMLERGVIGEDRLREVEELGVKKVIGLVEGAYSSGRAAWIREISARVERLREEIQTTDAKINKLRMELKKLENEIKGLEKYNGRNIQDLKSELNTAERQLTNLGWSGSVQQLESAISLLNERSQYLVRVVGERVMPDRAYLEGLDELLDREGNETLQTLIQSMESLPAELDLGELKRIDEEYAERNRQLGEKNSVLSERKRKVAELQGEIEKLRRIGEELSRAKRFYGLLEKIRDNVFHRDGPVLKSLRTWVYGRVSDRAREYLDMFDVRIDDVRIVEESGERGGVRFVCFYGGREVDSDRLSGGEKVALALAIRLAIGDVLGAQKLGFFILDEPTIHLDSENKKKLQEIFASLGELAGQTIVITHDEELFEDADATILRFERGPAPGSPTEMQIIRTTHEKENPNAL